RLHHLRGVRSDDVVEILEPRDGLSAEAVFSRPERRRRHGQDVSDGRQRRPRRGHRRAGDGCNAFLPEQRPQGRRRARRVRSRKRPGEWTVLMRIAALKHPLLAAVAVATAIACTESFSDFDTSGRGGSHTKHDGGPTSEAGSTGGAGGESAGSGGASG